MGKKKPRTKKVVAPDPPESKIIQSDPATVERMLQMFPPESDGDYIPLRRRRRYHTPTPHNQTHPYQGGLPGQGKGA